MDELNALFQVATGSPEPIYRQLMAQLQRRISAGLWAAGDELPSVRELAQALAINPMTVSKAYGLLEAQGWLLRRRGLAMVVAPTAAAAGVADRIELLRPTLARAAAEARQLGLPPSRALALFKTLLQLEPDPE